MTHDVCILPALFYWSLIETNIAIYLAPVVQRVDSAIHWINHYTVDNCYQK